MNLQDAIGQIYEIGGELVSDMEQIQPEQCGLDNRSGYRLFISDEGIAVSKANDRSLQYYGGFEYVEKECRIEIGEYVFYTNEDDRVQGHIDSYYDNEADED